MKSCIELSLSLANTQHAAAVYWAMWTLTPENALQRFIQCSSRLKNGYSIIDLAVAMEAYRIVLTTCQYDEVENNPIYQVGQECMDLLWRDIFPESILCYIDRTLNQPCHGMTAMLWSTLRP